MPPAKDSKPIKSRSTVLESRCFAAPPFPVSFRPELFFCPGDPREVRGDLQEGRFHEFSL